MQFFFCKVKETDSSWIFSEQLYYGTALDWSCHSEAFLLELFGLFSISKVCRMNNRCLKRLNRKTQKKQSLYKNWRLKFD